MSQIKPQKFDNNLFNDRSLLKGSIFMKKEYVVYAHLDPDTKEIVYIGKGNIKRPYDLSLRNRYGKHKEWLLKLKKEDKKPIVKILYRNLDNETAFNVERKTIKEMRERGNELLNITEGGKGCFGRKMSEKTKVKLIEINKNRVPPMLGKKHSSKTKKIMVLKRLEFINKDRDGFTKKVSKWMSGEKNHRFGKPALNRGSKHTLEARQKMSEYAKTRVPPRLGFSKFNFIVKDLESGENQQFNSVKDICESIKISRATVTRNKNKGIFTYKNKFEIKVMEV